MSSPVLTTRHASGHPIKAAAQRLAALDGLRALAIGWVAYYHYFTFWTPAGEGFSLLAYGDAYSGFPFVSVGYLGVSLFFVISGFVILLTLERTKSLKEFFIRRALRLWPSLLVFGTATFIIVGLFGPAEIKVGWWEYLLSLFVLPPHHVAMLVGAADWKWLDGAYWSLWVEVKFYVVIGTLFFVFSEAAIGAWMVFEFVVLAIGLLNFAFGGSLLHMADGFLFQSHVPYFSFGIAAYLIWSGQDGRKVRLLAALAIVHVAIVSAMHLATAPQATFLYGTQYLIAQVAIFAVVYLFAWRKWAPAFLQWSPVVRVGRASYGIYLMHQNLGVTLLSAPVFAATVPSLLGPVLVFSAFASIAILVFEQLELPLQERFKRRLLIGSGQGNEGRRPAAEAGPVRPLA